MSINNAIEKSEIKMAYRITNSGQIVIALEDGHLLFINPFNVGLSDEPVETESTDWVPIGR